MIQCCLNARQFGMLTKTHVEEFCFKTKNRPTPQKKSHSLSEITFIQAKIISKKQFWVEEVAPQLKALAILPEDQSSDVGWGSLSPVTLAQGTQHNLLDSTSRHFTGMCTHTHRETKRRTQTQRHRKKQRQTEKLYFQNINSQMSHEFFV